MKRDDVPLLPELNITQVLPKRTGAISLLQLEAQDSLQTVLEALHHLAQPVLLVLPAWGTVLSQPDHFVSLRHLFTEVAHPPLIHLVIPPWRANEAALAAYYGFPRSASIEEALRVVSSSFFRERRFPSESTALREKPFHARVERVRKDETSPPLSPLPSPTRKVRGRVFLIGGGLLLTLVVASALLLPLMLTPTQSQAGTAGVGSTVGTLAFLSSGQVDQDLTQGYNDLITLNLHGLPAPHAGETYYAWLMPDPSDEATAPLLLGTVAGGQTGQTALTYTSPRHTNLLASYSGVRVTEQASDPPPSTPGLDPASWRWEGWLPNTPAPTDENQYSFLAHLRHLLARDPTLSANNLAGGLVLWMMRNVAKVEEWASAAQGSWHGASTTGADLGLIHRHLLRILAYLDGQAYYWRDVPAGSPWIVDQQGGKIGLIDCVPDQVPSAYLEHVDIHVNGLANAPGHTSAQQQLAVLVGTVIHTMEGDLQRVRRDAEALVKMTPGQLRQPGSLVMLDEMANLTTAVKSGWLDPQTGENIGGVVWMMARIEQLATIAVSSST